jgi:PTS system nitrogen regulatory IIA component
MELTVRDVSRYLNASETTVLRWIKQKDLPARRVGGRYRINRTELLEWAIAHQVPVESNSADQYVKAQRFVSLVEALQAGGIHYRVPGDNQAAALREVVSRLPLPEDFDRELLLRLFLAREALGSTAVGDGVAIPHARRPIVLNVLRPLVTLCFLKRPIDYKAPDQAPVWILFSVISPTVAEHVQLLAQLSRALLDAGFRKSVVGAKPREVILREARRFENAAPSARGNRPHVA